MAAKRELSAQPSGTVEGSSTGPGGAQSKAELRGPNGVTEKMEVDNADPKAANKANGATDVAAEVKTETDESAVVGDPTPRELSSSTPAFIRIRGYPNYVHCLTTASK